VLGRAALLGWTLRRLGMTGASWVPLLPSLWSRAHTS
jgi:hypothetical protein